MGSIDGQEGTRKPRNPSPLERCLPGRWTTYWFETTLRKGKHHYTTTLLRSAQNSRIISHTITVPMQQPIQLTDLSKNNIQMAFQAFIKRANRHLLTNQEIRYMGIDAIFSIFRRFRARHSIFRRIIFTAYAADTRFCGILGIPDLSRDDRIRLGLGTEDFGSYL